MCMCVCVCATRRLQKRLERERQSIGVRCEAACSGRTHARGKQGFGKTRIVCMCMAGCKCSLGRRRCACMRKRRQGRERGRRGKERKRRAKSLLAHIWQESRCSTASLAASVAAATTSLFASTSLSLSRRACSTLKDLLSCVSHPLFHFGCCCCCQRTLISVLDSAFPTTFSHPLTRERRADEDESS